ncbi:MAG: lamin tail domain-containing protein [Flavobacteriales bacterium]|nr:lamin tail domain-containing protein [Flavobacteriales bacterium]
MKKLLLICSILFFGNQLTKAQIALNFDGVDDEVVSPGAGALIDGSNTWTIEFWYKSPTSGVPIAFSSDSYFLIHGCGLLIFYSANGYIQTNCSVLPLDNNFHHIAIRSDGPNNGQIFVDGNPVSMLGNTHTGFSGLATANLSIGSNQGFTDCTIDDVRIWDIARTNSEISANMNACLTGSEPDLVLLYDFEDGTGSSVVTDLAGSYNGVLTNMDSNTDWVTGVNCISSIPDLVITEIMYNPAESGADTSEFIEIYNNGATTVDLTNYTCTGGTYTFPNVNLAVGGYYVITIDSSGFYNTYGYNADGVFSNGLSNGGEAIVLKDAFGSVVDSVDYDDASPWPSGSSAGNPDGGGSSLILCDVNTDNNDGSNWSKSVNSTGVMINGFEVLASPGSANFCCPVITGTLDSTVCNGGSFVFNGTTYDTSNPTGTETLTSASGCDSLVSVTLTELPALTGTDNTTICAEESVVINGTTYDASNPTGIEVFTNVGPYNCDSTVTVALNVLPAITGSQTLVECAGFSVTVGTNTYTTTGVYTDVLTAANGCDSTVTTDLTINQPTTGSQTLVECAGFSVTVGTNTYTTTGVYTDVLTAANGCDSTVTTDLTVESAIDVTIDNTLAPTLTANQAGAAYQWLDCDNGNAIIPTETNQSFTATVNGNYAVEITVGSCVDTSACENITGVGIKEAATNVVSIYPNPTNGMFTINLANTKETVSYTVTTLEGRIVEQANNVSQNNIQVNLTNESKGVYFLIIQESNETVRNVHKILKQ